jgi:hypothetical protein
MPSDIVAYLMADAKALKQQLDALVTAIEATDEKVDTLLVVADLERQVTTAKKLIPRSMSSSIMETMTNSLSYEDTVITNLHI